MTDGSEWKSCLRTTNIPGYAAQQGTWRSATGISCTTSNTNAGASCQASWDCMNLCMNTGMYDCSHCDPALLCQGGTGGSTTVADATCTSGFYVCDSGKYWNGTHCQDKQCPAGFTVSGSKCVGSTGTPVAITAQSVCKSYTIGTGPTYTCVESGIWLDDSKKPFLYDASTPPKFITDPAQKNSAAQMCSQNTLVPIFKKYTPDFATFDFCASNECFAGTTNNPQCVASGEWSFAHRCEGSNGWVPRTQYLAESLYELREGDDFILHCDLPSETLNTHLIPDQFYTKKLINNVCVLSEPKGRKWEVVAAGVVLNTPSGKKEATVGEAILNPITATQRFTYALNSSDVNITNISCAQPLSANGFTKCATSSGALYYNSQYGILVFAKNDPGNPGTSWVGKLKALWSTAVGGRKNADNTGPIVPLAAQKIYLAHVGNREIQGVWQSTPAGAQIAVAYKNVNVNAVFPKNAPRTGASWFTTPTSEPILYFTDSGTNQAVWEAVTLAIRPQ